MAGVISSGCSQSLRTLNFNKKICQKIQTRPRDIGNKMTIEIYFDSQQEIDDKYYEEE